MSLPPVFQKLYDKAQALREILASRKAAENMQYDSGPSQAKKFLNKNAWNFYDDARNSLAEDNLRMAAKQDAATGDWIFNDGSRIEIDPMACLVVATGLPINGHQPASATHKVKPYDSRLDIGTYVEADEPNSNRPSA